jgi:hypothetical protein
MKGLQKHSVFVRLVLKELKLWRGVRLRSVSSETQHTISNRF